MQYCWGKCQEFWNCRNVISIWSEKLGQRFETSVQEDISTLSVAIGTDHSVIKVFLVDHLQVCLHPNMTLSSISSNVCFFPVSQQLLVSHFHEEKGNKLGKGIICVVMECSDPETHEHPYYCSWPLQALVFSRSSQMFVFGISIQILWWALGMVPGTDPHFCHSSVGQHIWVKCPFSLQTVHVRQYYSFCPHWRPQGYSWW